jgi:hypothetical protein
MDRIRLMFSGSWPTLMGVLIWLVILLVIGDTWPNQWYTKPAPVPAVNRMAWLDFLIFSTAAVFLSVKSTIMLQRMGNPIDRLTLALVAVNFAFVVLYVYAVSRPIVPSVVNTHPKADELVTLGVRVMLIWTLTWSLWSLTNTRPIVIIESNGKPIAWTGEQIGGEMTMTATPPDDAQEPDV